MQKEGAVFFLIFLREKDEKKKKNCELCKTNIKMFELEK